MSVETYTNIPLVVGLDSGSWATVERCWVGRLKGETAEQAGSVVAKAAETGTTNKDCDIPDGPAYVYEDNMSVIPYHYTHLLAPDHVEEEIRCYYFRVVR
jgi:hypothetical protein